MSPLPSGSGWRICRRSIWANSAATRPRLSQTPRRMVSISAADFSGKAAARLARPIRCSFSRGPKLRMKPPAMSAMRLRLVVRMTLSIPTASHPSAATAAALAGGAKPFDAVMANARGGSSERDDDLSEHLPAFESRQPALEIGERNLGIDHRREAARHLGEALADVPDGRAK